MCPEELQGIGNPLEPPSASAEGASEVAEAMQTDSTKDDPEYTVRIRILGDDLLCAISMMHIHINNGNSL